MVTLKITLGLLLLIVAWGYIFQKRLIFKLNAWMRNVVFSDELALFSGRRVAVLLILLGGISLFSGLEKLIVPMPIQPQIANQILTIARKDFSEKRYSQVIVRCRQLVQDSPNNIAARELMVHAYSRMGEKELARQAAQVLLRLDPKNPIGNSNFQIESKKLKLEKKRP
ncbi:MAG: hypothetical protein KCHDKBKB_00813 [Elusimicrobia bacterium]|nr:hypothetical protein [Elusimicrobiota bacterium]